MKKETFQSGIHNFRTDRLTVDNIKDDHFVDVVKNILTPKVTKYLPDGWQNLSYNEDINNWIKDRDSESCFLNLRMSNTIVGFCFLSISETETEKLDVRFGYLLSEGVWDKGLGTEFIRGLVNYCNKLEIINSISGGVERQNSGSIRVLEKTGFVKESEKGNTLFYRKGFKRL
ncbi:GNAT family N-acetyltransferase [Leptobacterium flavescens]|uniref:GNAT family N-acetyltransferase n=1 Tax=Leptobacterium flavescens TaxID=472055 RepID=A0A6P0UL23_9FLAO|nr:GNAT family N-acetyltransferase [Leptobacterium flavescens]NER12598.1 GNAT family N-acetyltransferase [Leptobacterium flavescens]